MKPREWLMQRAAMTDGRIRATVPEVAPAPAREIPVKSPRIPEDPIFTFGKENIFAEGEKGKKEILCAQGEEIGPLGAARGGTGMDGAEKTVPPPRPARRTDPHFTPGGTLVIPFESDPKYHWWKGGQSVDDTIAELKAREAQAEAAEPAFGECFGDLEGNP